jgi:choline-sulfatase
VPRRTEPEHPYFTWWRQRTGIEDLSPQIEDRCRTAYYALVDRMDAMIGQVLRALEENGLAENTLIVYSTDHGEQAGEHGLWWKQTMYEASARVPMLASWPGILPEGRRNANVTSTLDLTATILDAAGSPPLPDMAGSSFLPLLKGETTEWEDEAFSEFCVEEGWFHRMIRRGPWKLVHYHRHRPQLFNLWDDPDELHDLAADPRFASVREDLTNRVLADWHPDQIEAEHTLKHSQSQILRQWARTTHPREQYRWPITREMHYLDEPLPPEVKK